MAVQTKLCGLLNNLNSFRSVLSNRVTSVPPAFGISTETKAKLKTLPEKPKKPQTTFISFCQDHREDIVKKNPKAKFTEITQLLAKEWKSLNEEAKKRYEEKYKDEMVVYTKEHLDYLANLTDEQKEILSKAAEEKKHIKETRELHKFYKESNKPKRFKTAYMFYLGEQSAAAKQPLRVILNECKGKWSKMTDAEKSKYLKMSDDDKKRYETEMITWESKMIEEGRLNLVRKSTLDEKKPKRTPTKNVTAKGDRK